MSNGFIGRFLNLIWPTWQDWDPFNPLPGPTPPPPPPPPPPPVAPTIRTEAVDPVGATSATFQGTVLSMGTESTVNAFFRYREGASGDYTETTPEAVAAPGGVSLEQTGLEADTAHEMLFVVSYGDLAQEVVGATIAFTTGGLSGQPEDDYDSLVADAITSLSVEGNSFSGLTGEWTTPPESFRSGAPTSLIVGDQRQTLLIDQQSYEIPNSQLTGLFPAAFTIILPVQFPPSANGWHILLGRGSPWVAGEADGAFSLARVQSGDRQPYRLQIRIGGANYLLELSANEYDWEIGKIDTVVASLGARGLELRVAGDGNLGLVNDAVTSLTSAITKPLFVGSNETGGAVASWATTGFVIFNSQLTIEEQDAIAAQVKTEVRWAPPVSIETTINSTASVALNPSRFLMATVAPTLEVTTQPSNAVAFADGGLAAAGAVGLAIEGTSGGQDSAGRYRLVDDNGASNEASITAVVIADSELPEVEVGTVGTAASANALQTASGSVGFAGYTPEAGDLWVAQIASRSGRLEPPSLGAGWQIARSVNASSDDLNNRLRLDFFYRFAAGTEGANPQVGWTWASDTTTVAFVSAYRLPSEYRFTQLIQTVEEIGFDKISTSMQSPQDGLAYFFTAMWSSRIGDNTPLGNPRMVSSVTDVSANAFVSGADFGIAGAMGSLVVAPNTEIPDGTEYN